MRLIPLILCFITINSIKAQSQATNPDFLDAMTLYNNRDFHGVIKSLDIYLKNNPTHAEGWYYKGLSKLFLSETSGTCYDFNKALELGLKKDEKFIKYHCDTNNRIKLLKEHYYEHDSIFKEYGYRPRYTRGDTLRGSLRKERSCFDVTFYDLTIQLFPSKKTIEGTNTIWFTVKEKTNRIQLDLFKRYTISEISWNGKPLIYTREFNAVFIDFPEDLPVDSKQQITFKYEGKPKEAINPPWDGGFVWKRDKHHHRWIGVACEHLGASSWWPNKDHPSDESDSMRMTFIAPKKYDIVCNGVMRSIKKFDSKNNQTTWFISYPINNYNATFYMGKFTHFADSIVNGTKKLMLDYYVLPFNLDNAKKTFVQNKQVIECYQKYYGDYPFPRDGFGMIESPFAGMEHQGAIAFGNGYGKNKRLINKNWDYIIVHEDAHEWWGNSITGADMADMWIQEGFATYSELLFLECVDGYGAYLKEVNQKMNQIFNFWPMVDHHGVNEYSFASGDIYYKGALILNNLRSTINNDSIFFKLIKDFATQKKLSIVTTEDFVNFVNDFTHENYTPFFNKYLKDTKLPVLEYSFRKYGDDILLNYKWTGVESGFKMPLCITAKLRTYRLEATTSEQEIKIKNANTFMFYNQYTGSEGIEKNSYTYYNTHCINFK